MNYFDELKKLLDVEHQYDKLQHEELLFRKSLQERKIQGVTWYPITISQTEIGRGDYLHITIQKTNDLSEGHKFRFGMPVSLFSNYDPTEDRINGTISFVSRDTMRIALRVDELPDWSRRGKIGVDLLFDENSYKEMQDALVQAKEIASDKKNGQLIRQLIGEEAIYAPAVVNKGYENIALNASQNEAINNILQISPLSIVNGPPGTGKTTTLVHAVQALLKQEKKQILLVAPSNTAVDLLVDRLANVGVKVVRIGNSVKVSDHLQALTLDGRIDAHDANKEIKVLTKQARAYMDMAHKYKRSFGKAERDQRKALFDESRKIRREIDKIQDYIASDILNNAEVIACTLVGANHYSIRDRQYQTVIIDEAAQALEPACWIPILKAESVILAGDHLQLPPTVKSNKNATVGLYITLFEKLIKLYPAQVHLLDTQYRMHTAIMQYPSESLYEGKLLAHESVANRVLTGDTSPVLFIDTAGAGFEEKVEDDAIANEEEASFLVGHLVQYLKELQVQTTETSLPTVGVITPYRKQSIVLKELVANHEVVQSYPGNVQVHTIDSFQGQEKDIIYISLTRSNAQQLIGFLADVRRMNVAMTRAKRKLIVIGDSATVGNHLFYKGFLDYVSTLESYHSVWEWEMN